MASFGENELNFGVHNTSAFCTDTVFKSREDLFDWVQNVGRSLGYVIVTKRSKKDACGIVSKVGLICDRGGVYESKSSIRKTGSKKINCPFQLVGKHSKAYGVWKLRVICGNHNHEPKLHMEGHTSAMRLSGDETRLVFDLSRKNVTPQTILSTLKEQNKNNVSTIQTVYNARYKFQKTQHTDTFVRQVVNSVESISPSVMDTLYAFNENGLKRTIVNTDPFATRNWKQELDSAKYGPSAKEIEDLLPRKQMLMPSVPSLQADLMERNHVKCVSIANPVTADVAMCYDGNEHDTNAPDVVDVPTSANHGDENDGNYGVHNTSASSSYMVFKSLQDLFDWVQKVGRSRGYVIITKRSTKNASGVTSRVTLMCDRGGICKSKSSIRNRGTKKINCSFKLIGKYLKAHDVWTLRVVCEKHNHEPTPHLEGHPYAMRLSADEARLVFDLSRKNVAPQAILSTLKEQNKNNVSTIRTIYNARQKFRRTQHAETFTRQAVNSDGRASPSLANTVYTSDASKLMRTIDHTNPFAIRNCVQGLDSAQSWPAAEDIEDLLFPRKHPSLQADFLATNHVKVVQSDSDTEEDDLQYDVNFDGLADIWKEMTVGLESSKDADMDLSINQVKEDEEECDHSFILKEDIGYVCRVCGVVERGIESIIEFKFPKRSKSTQTYYHEGRSHKSGELAESACVVLDGVKSTAEYFSVGEISVHPRHKKQMKPHQIEGFNFLLSNLVSDNPGGCILAHAPGSGKTFMLISFIQSFMAKYPDARPLVVLPRGILATWKKEFKRWQVEDIPLLDFYSQKADNRAQQLLVIKQWANQRSILFLGYKQFSTIVCDNDRSSVSATCKEILSTFPSLVILDEGHTPRNKNTDVFTAVEKVQTPRKVVLSGTLYQNHVCELFNILNLVRPRFLKMEDSKTIKRRILSRVSIETRRNLYNKCTDNEFCEVVEHTLQKDENFKRKVMVIEDLRAMTKNVLHYYKGDFLDELPGHVDFSVFLNLSPRQKRDVCDLKKLARKFKICSDGSAIYVHPDLKSLVKTIQEKNDDDVIEIDRVLEKLDEREGVKAKFFLNLLRLCTSTGEKLLVFGQYLLPLEFLLRLTMKVKGWSLNKEIFMITGDHDNEVREVAMDQFNNSSEAKVFFGSIKACGEGISLVGASRIIILDVHLNPSVTRQAIGRAFRPGQVRKVYTYRLVAAGSPEEEDHTTCHRKESIAKMLFEYNEYCGQNEFEMVKTDIKDCGDQFLQTPWLNEDVIALYKRS